jgi:hypothetical protein
VHLGPIRQYHNFRRRKVPDFHECRAVCVRHRNLLSNRNEVCFPTQLPAALFAECPVPDNGFKSTKCHVRAGSVYGIIGPRLENVGYHTSNSDRPQLSVNNPTSMAAIKSRDGR